MKTPEFSDGRYIPGSVSSSGVIANAGADPFTGEGRYVPAQNDVANPVQRGSAFTAGDGEVSFARSTTIPQDKMRPRGEFIPLTDYFRFGFERVSPKAIAKLKEMNELQLDHRLTDQQGRVTGRNVESAQQFVFGK
ncbi:unnamed protein product [Toxocara canis]|uniref:Structural protein n=1 Tax=Toxocara canis TaxID=6265 RepID=A0A183V5V9_TOXCA|nr:unnamed protein product [Toxocara canis]